MPLLEAFPNEQQMLKYKLVTVPRDTAVMPVISTGQSIVTLAQNAQITITPQTLNYLGNSGAGETSGYVFTVSDVRQFNSVLGSGITTTQADTLNATQTNGTDVSKTVIGTTLTLAATGVNTLFGNVGASTSTLFSLLTIVGRDSGARLQIPINITRT